MLKVNTLLNFDISYENPNYSPRLCRHSLLACKVCLFSLFLSPSLSSSFFLLPFLSHKHTQVSDTQFPKYMPNIVWRTQVVYVHCSLLLTNCPSRMTLHVNFLQRGIFSLMNLGQQLLLAWNYACPWYKKYHLTSKWTLIYVDVDTKF